MPIIGLTDRQGSFPQIGQLRKGSAKPSQGGYGKDLKHFRFTSTDADALAAFEQAYGPQPSTVEVFLPYHTTAENFEAWREAWKAGGMVHRCDGKTMVLWRRDDGSYCREPRPCTGDCKQVGRLKIIIPALKRFAYVTVLTSSIHDIIELNENLLAMEALRGSLQGVPMLLSRKPKMISMPAEDGKRRRLEKWLLSIEAKPEWVALQLLAMERQALGIAEAPPRPALVDTRHGSVDAETGEIFDEPEPEEPEEVDAEPVERADIPEDDITRRQREQRERAEKRSKLAADLNKARAALKAANITPRAIDPNEAHSWSLEQIEEELKATLAQMPAAA